ncbi:extracellular solute-binding protein [Microbacterium sp. H1-D42]|uniref:ABC transporter substrate-binding protein n=1 Tax=Microbacterium sp. H1-D42 TaxID=2925844 RepID=UPI001F533D66|nr:extracellular solute-binding protein [Microbacterium sp. H1-D42]UNK70493.1 extracellular solute-binding protein [Microbacterium sp. H1-D42]
MKSTAKHRHLRKGLAAIALVASAVIVAGCASVEPTKQDAAEGFTPVKQDETSEINVLVDPTRQAAVEAYQAAHPDAKIKIETFDGLGLQAKISLLDKAGSGWPDVIFSPGTADSAWASQSSGGGVQPFAAPLNQDIVPQATLDEWAEGSLAPCESGGDVYCLRNDLAQTVTWYNKALFDEWGYEVPTTWEDYEALGLKVADEHPGYLIGQIGDPNSLDVYFWASRCSAQENTDDPKTIKVNMTTPECTRVATMLDNLIEAGVMGKQSYFEKGIDGSKLLMAVGPSWYGKYLFEATYNAPAGQIGVADQPQWEGDSEASNGSVGGGIWMVSSHSKNLKAASDLAVWATSDTEFQKTAPTYPANTKAASAWLENPDNIAYFATDVKAPFEKAAGQTWKGWANTTFLDQDPYKNVVLTAVNGGKTVTSVMGDWQTEAANTAKAAGYKVVE